MKPDRYTESLIAGRCTRGSCKRPALDGAALCQRHEASEKKRQSDAAKDRRTARRANGMCAECGAAKSKAYRCAECATRYTLRPSTPPRTSVVASVTTPTADDRAPEREGKRQYYAPGEAPEGYAVDATGRRRLKTGRGRGAPSVADRREQMIEEFEWALDEIGKAREALTKIRDSLRDVAWAPLYADRPRIEIRLAEGVAKDHLRYASRILDGIDDRLDRK